MCTTLRNSFMTAFGVVGTIAADARDGLVSGNLVEQAGQYRRVAGSVIGYLDGPDFQRGCINAQVDFAPLATVLSAVLLGLALAFTQHLDAGAVH